MTTKLKQTELSQISGGRFISDLKHPDAIINTFRKDVTDCFSRLRPGTERYNIELAKFEKQISDLHNEYTRPIPTKWTPILNAVEAKLNDILKPYRIK